MSTAEIITAVLALLNIVGGIVGKHIIGELRERIRTLEAANHSAVLQSRLDACSETIDSLWDQIGRSSEEGMRKTVHHTANRCTENGLSVAENYRRIENLERRVFNGSKR